MCNEMTGADNLAVVESETRFRKRTYALSRASAAPQVVRIVLAG